VKLCLILLACAACGGAPFEAAPLFAEHAEAAAPDALEEPSAEGSAPDALPDGGVSEQDARGEADAAPAEASMQDAPSHDAAPVVCSGATAPGQFYVRTVTPSDGAVSCKVEQTPTVSSYMCSNIITAWPCPYGPAVACRDTTSTPPLTVVELDCPQP
jgi:hypothetical protein